MGYKLRVESFRQALAIIKKDLRVELRAREVYGTVLLFAVMVLLVFSFTFVDDGNASVLASSGVLWASLTFAGMLALGRVFEREGEGGTMQGLLAAPVERWALLLAKTSGVAALMLAVEVAVVPLVGVLFGAPVLAYPAHLAALVVLGTIAFSLIGATFSGILLGSRMRAVLLPVMLIPIAIPALIAGCKGTAALFADPASTAIAWFWIKFLLGFDAMVGVVALWVFESLVTE
ncbi:MAG: heme exporter protein CcmB [Pseudomonadota bacterium]